MRVGLSAQVEGGTAGGAPRSDSPWLSILIPVYNVEPYLRDCLASLLPQLPPRGVEVILLDDASTDGSLGLCSEICPQSHPQVRLMRHASNAGLSAARNTMLGAARGDYIWFVDSDDEVMPGAIAGLRAIVERHAPDLVLCDYERGGRHLSSFSGPTGQPSDDREALLQGVFARLDASKILRRRRGCCSAPEPIITRPNPGCGTATAPTASWECCAGRGGASTIAGMTIWR